MPVSAQDSIRQTAEGMIRNYAEAAALEAETIAARIGDKDHDGRELWSSVARQIRALQTQR